MGTYLNWCSLDFTTLGRTNAAGASCNSEAREEVGRGDFTNIPDSVLFWAAYVLSRPLGATLGDTLTKPHTDGGLALGRIHFFARDGGCDGDPHRSNVTTPARSNRLTFPGGDREMKVADNPVQLISIIRIS
jgi:hypothetical protein